MVNSPRSAFYLIVRFFQVVFALGVLGTSASLRFRHGDPTNWRNGYSDYGCWGICWKRDIDDDDDGFYGSSSSDFRSSIDWRIPLTMILAGGAVSAIVGFATFLTSCLGRRIAAAAHNAYMIIDLLLSIYWLIAASLLGKVMTDLHLWRWGWSVGYLSRTTFGGALCLAFMFFSTAFCSFYLRKLGAPKPQVQFVMQPQNANAYYPPTQGGDGPPPPPLPGAKPAEHYAPPAYGSPQPYPWQPSPSSGPGQVPPPSATVSPMTTGNTAPASTAVSQPTGEGHYYNPPPPPPAAGTQQQH